MQDYVKAFSTFRYSTWIEADHLLTFSRCMDASGTNILKGTGGKIVRKRDCPAENGTVGMYGVGRGEFRYNGFPEPNLVCAMNAAK